MTEPKPSEQYDYITIPSQKEPIPVMAPTPEQRQNIAVGLTMLYDAQPDSVKQEIRDWVKQRLRHELEFAAQHPKMVEATR